jgi:CubicO group peptidase (beta-lactamase class C family)
MMRNATSTGGSMKNRRCPAAKHGAGLFLISMLLALPLVAASIQGAKPEDVGLSSDRLQRIHEVMERHIQAGDIAGGVTLVARKGRLAHLEAHGVMDLESRKPMPKDGIFRIASMSKPITGTAILLLMEEGKIRLTDPVSRFIPEFRGLKVAMTQQPSTAAGTAEPQFYTVPANREITIRDLLTHVSGLVSGPISTAEAAKFARQPNDTLADYVPRLGAVPLEFQPGSQWRYSPGAGFDTLGRIVEIVSGQTFDQFLRQRIFDPLGIKDLYFKPGEAGMARLATVYRKNAGSLEKQTRPDYANLKYFSGAGGLLSTTEDYLQFAEMLLNGGQLNGKRLLSPKTVELMAAVHVPDTLPGRPKGRGFGLSVQVVSDAVAANLRVSDGSYGWDGAFGTHFWIDPKEKIVGILMVQTPNQEVSRDFENAVMQAVVE